MRGFFMELLQYNHHYNQLLADLFLRNQNSSLQLPHRLFSHILNAHHIWNNRIQPKMKPNSVWEVHNVESFASIDRYNYEYSIHLLETIDMETLICYRNSKGQAFESSPRDILFHIINHSTYHRGQIALELRKSDVEPLPTDFIFYKRE